MPLSEQEIFVYLGHVSASLSNLPIMAEVMFESIPTFNVRSNGEAKITTKGAFGKKRDLTQKGGLSVIKLNKKNKKSCIWMEFI